MSNQIKAIINTRLQPGDEDVLADEPFQRLAGAEKTVETVLTFQSDHHRAEAR